MKAVETCRSTRAREALRRQFRPDKVRMLFVGESPPASGRFFYRGDSGLYRAVRQAFQTVDRSITDEDFLSTFKSTGCYLVDLCGTPVDKLDPKARRDACLAGERVLTRKIRQMHPDVIISLVRSIGSIVERAAAQAGWKGSIVNVPYPGRWIRHRKAFITGLTPHLIVNMGKEKGC